MGLPAAARPKNNERFGLEDARGINLLFDDRIARAGPSSAEHFS
jgi:hypothetical protein